MSEVSLHLAREKQPSPLEGHIRTLDSPTVGS